MCDSRLRFVQRVVWPLVSQFRRGVSQSVFCQSKVLNQGNAMELRLRGRKRIPVESSSDKVSMFEMKPPRKTMKASRTKSMNAVESNTSSSSGRRPTRSSDDGENSLAMAAVNLSVKDEHGPSDNKSSSMDILTESRARTKKTTRKLAEIAGEKNEPYAGNGSERKPRVRVKKEPADERDSWVSVSAAESEKGGRSGKKVQAGSGTKIKLEAGNIEAGNTIAESDCEASVVGKNARKAYLGKIAPTDKRSRKGAVALSDKNPTKLADATETRKDSDAWSAARCLKIPDSGTPGSKFVGAHTSIAGGLYRAVETAAAIGAKAFGLFLKSQRQWAAKPLADEDAEKFREALKTAGFHPSSVLPHGCYLLNCGSPNPEMLSKSRACLLEELQRCEKLGLPLYNFHPGSSCGEIEVEECLDRIAESINLAHAQTKYVVTVIENMCGQGNTVGGRFEELRGIIERVQDKSRVGVCLDTCHAFAAGYELNTEAGFRDFVDSFDAVVGLQYLRGLHLNDSKGKLGCHLDRHENIGRGELGLETFRRLMNEERFNNIPMIIETPPGLSDEEEIRLLYSLCQPQPGQK